MALLYKLTDEHGRTYGGTQWGPGITHRATGRAGQDLCSDGWIHAHENPLLAVLLNPIHTNFAQPRLWEARGKIGKRDGQMKCGCRALTTVREIALPEITTEQRVRFAVGCSRQYNDTSWHKWAEDWLSGKDRTAAAAESAAESAAGAAAKAAWAAESAAGAAWAAGARAAKAAARVSSHTEMCIIIRAIIPFDSVYKP